MKLISVQMTTHLVIVMELKLFLENKCVQLHTGSHNQVSVYGLGDLHCFHHQRHPKGYYCI